MNFQVYLINNLCEELEGILLLANVDGLSKKSETSPKLLRDVMLQLRLQQVAENVLQLVENGLLVNGIHLDV